VKKQALAALAAALCLLLVPTSSPSQAPNADGAIFTQYAVPAGKLLSCGVTGIGTTLTEVCAAPASGISIYIKEVISHTTTGTVGLFTLRFGTGANCGAGTGNLFFASASALMGNPGNTVAPNHFRFATPIKVTAANAVCVLGVVTNTSNVQILGWTGT
jgi:hypothetical protein